MYVYKSNGDLYGTYVGPANHYRGDLEAAGYGNGCHGFQIPIDFISMPEERLTIDFHYVDNSGYHPVFYTGYYEDGNITTPTQPPTTLYVWPTASKRITQNFKSGTHNGLDIGAVTAGVAGDPIYCMTDGNVTWITHEDSSTYGHGVYINHINPKQSISTYLQTKYAHMVREPNVVVGESVSKGEIIGYMGNTGDSRAVHLHFETIIAPNLTEKNIAKSYCIDPLNYFDSSGNVLAYNINSSDANDNPWGLIFDINDIEIDTYDRINLIENEETIKP